ncbi:MAG: CHAT domain-containing tetratricopeptide repeat protein, partial [Cyanobacteria bacterium]|nr:CHAT domain-containing tetratricopeptide repeat protein [Cyanobacteriota bacterium]MDW8203096.1 tetratricopeptide repeat protein [Cyanobacteriota bacterium SKYGB_h_bin112]
MQPHNRRFQSSVSLKSWSVALALLPVITPPLIVGIESLPAQAMTRLPWTKSASYLSFAGDDPSFAAVLSLGSANHLLPLQVAQASPREQEALRLNREGNQLLAQRRSREALAKYLEALKILQEVGNRQGEGVLLLNVANAYEQLNQDAEALQYLQRSVAVLREVGNRGVEASALGNLGVVYDRVGQPDQAIAAFQQALAIQRELGNREGEATVLSNMANVYRSLGKFQQALELLDQAIVIKRDIGDRSGEMAALTNTAATYNALGRSDKALDLYQQALALSRELKDRSAEATLLNNLGRTYDRLNQLPRALDYYQQSLAMLQAIGDRRRESLTLSNIASVYSRLGQRDQAIKGYEQALAIVEALNDRPSQATILNNLGALYGELGNRQRALDYYQRSLPLLQAVGKRVEEGITLSNMGLSYLNLKDYRNAERYLFAAVELWESLRPGLTDQNKVALFETQLFTYRSLQEALVAQRKVEQALEVSERGRSRAFAELLASQLQATDTTSKPSDNLTTAQTLKPMTIAAIKQVAKEQKATLVEYSIIGDDLLYIWVVQPTGTVAFQQVDLSNLPREQGISPLLSLINNSRANDLGVRGRGISFVEDITAVRQATAQSQSSGGNDRPHLQRLYTILVQSIAQHLPTNPNDRVIFIPQGELFFVPFPALQTSDGQYLVQKHTILTAPAIQVLQLTHQRRLATTASSPSLLTNALIVGNPTMPSIGNPPQQLSSLPGAEAE